MTSLPPFVPEREPPEEEPEYDNPDDKDPTIRIARAGIVLVLLFWGMLALGIFADDIVMIFGKYDKAIEALAGVAVAAFTGTLWLSTRRMQRVTERTLRHLVKTNTRELRAYVFPITPTIGSSPSGGHAVKHIELTVKNWGSTPAYNVCCSIVPYHGPAHIYAFPDWGNSLTRGVNSIIPPDGVLESVIDIPKAKEIEQAAIEVGAAETRVIRLHGRVKYRDAYGKQQTAEFAYVSEGDDLRRGRFRAIPDTHHAS